MAPMPAGHEDAGTDLGRPVRLGVIGLGIATRLMLPVMSGFPGLQVAAAADLRADARQRFSQQLGAPAYSSVQELLASADIDAVYIATPSYLHADHIEMAAQAGRHILVEKPMALTKEECQRIVDVVAQHQVSLVCGHTHGYNPAIVRMGEIVRSGQLGELTMIATWNYTNLMYRPRARWELNTEQGGGAVFMQAPHQIDIIRTIAGRPLGKVSARAIEADPNLPTAGGYAALLTFTDGVPATAVYSGYGYFDSAQLHHWRDERGRSRDPATHALTWKRYLAELGDEQRTASAEPESREKSRYGGEIADSPGLQRPSRQAASFFGMTIVSCSRGDICQTPEGLAVFDSSGRHELAMEELSDGATAVLDELCDAVRHNRETPHGVTWARDTTFATIGILDSAACGKEVMLAGQ